jgi:hypothetical protein
MICNVIVTKKDNGYTAKAPDHLISRNPWLDKFGFLRDDPTFDDLQEKIRKVRIESDRIER